MAEQQTAINKTSESTPPQVIIEATPANEKQKTDEDQAIESLREVQENAGQIAELSAEEENLVAQFLDSLLKILKPFGKTLELSVSALPENYKDKVSKAFLYPTGQVVLTYGNGEAEIVDLSNKVNRDTLIKISSEIMMKLRTVIDAYKSRTEKRVKFLMSITKELQKVAEIFSEK